MYVIKQLPEDFVVEEIMPLSKPTGGQYAYCVMQKTQLTTFEAVCMVAKKLAIPLKYIKYSGNKDKDALTSQTISIFRVPQSKIESFSANKIRLELIGFYQEPIFVGMHSANRFIITARNLDSPPKILHHFVNYFGRQRFGTNNVEIGRSIAKKDFEQAAQLLADQGNTTSQSHLKDHPNDYIGAIRNVQKLIVKLCLHSFQSHIWNRTAILYLQNNPHPKQIKIPIIGFATELGNDEISQIAKKILEEEKLAPMDFVIRQLPEISIEGGERDLFADVKDLKIKSLEQDDLNPGRKKCVLTFTLSKGCYATVLIDQIFS